jgi:hypothetical protein
MAMGMLPIVIAPSMAGKEHLRSYFREMKRDEKQREGRDG